MPAGVETLAEPLAKELARVRVLSVSQAVDIVRQLAHEVARQHETGCLYLHIAAETILYDSTSGQVALRESPDEARPFGGENNDDEFCPPELLEAPAVFLPVNIAAACEALRSADLAAVDPRRVDLYQLGALLCRLLTGEGVSDFLSRPRVAAKVTPEIRDLIERALGHDSQRAFRSASELLRALDSLDAAITTALPNAQPGSTRNAAKPDTTPSVVGVGKADTDVGRPAPSPTNEAELPFAKLGHYEIVGRLGHGGMGDVYKGYEPQLDRQVAIKVLPVEFSRQEEMVKRFYAEASAAAKLVHPNTVEIHFIGQDEVSSAEGQLSKVHFFAMRFVEGESLADLLARRQRLNVDETLAIIEQALAGLSAAHRLGMVHRDIKPGNILIDRERQRVLLADFGLVKSLQAAASMTASGVIVGTVDYMAPEQGRGENVDARADLYAIGVVLYQMLSGRLPFQADSPTGMIFKHVYESPPPLHDIAPNVPRSLTDIVSKLMSKSPDARYQTVEALLADLKAFHQGQRLPSSAASIAAMPERPRSVIIPAPRFAEESVLPATLTQIAAPDRWRRTRQAIRDFLLIPAEEFVQQLQTTENQVDGAIAEYERRHQSLVNAVRDAESVVQEYETERETWRRAIADAEQRATSAPDDDSARAALAEKLRAERVLSELSEQLNSQQSQLSEMRHKLLQVSARLESLRSQRDVLNARLKVARAQIRLAGGNTSGHRAGHWARRLRWLNVSVLALVSTVLIGVLAVLFKAALSSVSSEAEVAEIEKPPPSVLVEEKFESARTMAELFLNPPTMFGQPFSGGGDGQKQILKMAVSPTGKHVATASGERTALIWDAESGRLLHRLSGDLREIYSIAFNHDGTILATGQSNGEMPLKFWNVGTGELINGPSTYRDSFNNLISSPAGPYFATSDSGNLKIWNSETLQKHWSTKTNTTEVSRLAFNSDGTLLAGFGGSEVFVWDMKERKLITSWVIKSDIQPDHIGPLFLPGGSEFLTSNGADAILRWEARTGKLLSQTPSGLPAYASLAAISPDGRWLAAYRNSSIVIVDTRSGFIRTAMSGHQATALAFSPRSDKLFSAGGPPFLVRWDIASLPVLTGKGWSQEITSNPPYAFASQKPLCLLSVGTQLGVWNYETKAPLLQLKTDSSLAAGTSAAFSSDALQVAVLEKSGRFRVWDVLSGRPSLSTRISDSLTSSQAPQLAFAEDGKVVWVATTTRLWRVDLLKKSAEPWMDWPGDTTVVALSPKARFSVVSSFREQLGANGGTRWQAFDIATRRALIPDDKASHVYRSFAFTRDEQRLLALNNQGEFHHWKLESSDLLARFRLSRQDVAPYQLMFLPDQRHVVAFWHPWLRVIDVERGEEVLNFQAQATLDQSEVTRTNQQNRQLLHISHDGHFAATVDPSKERLDFWNLYLQHNLGK